MAVKLIVAFVAQALGGCLLHGAVRALEPAIRPRLPRLGHPLFDAEFAACRLKRMAEVGLRPHQHLPDIPWRPGTASGLCDMRALVGKRYMELVGDGGGEGAEEFAGHASRGFRAVAQRQT